MGENELMGKEEVREESEPARGKKKKEETSM